MELQELLNYLRGREVRSAFTRKLEEEVHRARKQNEWKVEYMTLLMRDQENIEKGITQGITQGKAESIIEILEEKGQISEELKNTIFSENRVEVLKRWLKTALKSDTIEEFMQSINNLK